MKLKLAKAINPSFSEAFARLALLPLSAKDAYSVAKASRLLGQEARDFDAGRTAVLKKYGKSEDDGKSYRIEAQEDIEKANAEITELAEKEIDLPINPVAIPAAAQMTARDILLLEELIQPDVPLIVQP